jgi:antitoxin component of MazEF toxin-antitoxin module
MKMALKRKLRVVGSSLVATIPSDIANLFNLNDGDTVSYEVDPTYESITLKKSTED